MLKDIFSPNPSDNRFVYTVKALADRFVKFDISRTGASLAYFFFLSLFPFLLFINALIGSFKIPADEITAFLSPLLPKEIVDLVVSYNHHIGSDNGTPMASFGIIFTLFAASGAVKALISAINLAHGIDQPRGIVKDTVISIIFTVALGFMILLSVVTLSLAGQPLSYFAMKTGLADGAVRLLRAAGWGAVLVIVFLVLMMLYTITPNRKMTFKAALPGALTALIGFIALSLGFSAYMEHFSNYTAIYGAIGAVMALLLLLYLAGMVFTIGAHINSIWEEYRS